MASEGKRERKFLQFVALVFNCIEHCHCLYLMCNGTGRFMKCETTVRQIARLREIFRKFANLMGIFGASHIITLSILFAPGYELFHSFHFGPEI